MSDMNKGKKQSSTAIAAAPATPLPVLYVIQRPAVKLAPQLPHLQATVRIVSVPSNSAGAARLPHFIFTGAVAIATRDNYHVLHNNAPVKPTHPSNSPIATPHQPMEPQSNKMASGHADAELHWDVPMPLVPTAPPPPSPPAEKLYSPCLLQQTAMKECIQACLPSQPRLLRLSGGGVGGGEPGRSPQQVAIRPTIGRQATVPQVGQVACAAQYNQPPKISDRRNSELLQAVNRRLSEPNSLAPLGRKQQGSNLHKNEALQRRIVSGLLQCPCRDPSTLHPVCSEPSDPNTETVEADDLLKCERCQETICVPQRLARLPALPRTVAELRHLFKGQLSCGGTKQPYQMVKVYDIDDLSPGCQVAFRRAIGYYHHAIVTNVMAESFDTVEYDLGGGGGGGSGGGSLIRVLQRSRRLAKEAQNLYRVDYRSLDCFSPETVVTRARQQLDRSGYSLISSNCEHLAVWAKTGAWESFQLRKMEKLLQGAAEHGETHQRIRVVDPKDEQDETSATAAHAVSL